MAFYEDRMGNRGGRKGDSVKKKERFRKSPFCTFATGLESGSELQLLLCDTGNLLSAAL